MNYRQFTIVILISMSCNVFASIDRPIPTDIVAQVQASICFQGTNRLQAVKKLGDIIVKVDEDRSEFLRNTQERRNLDKRRDVLDAIQLSLAYDNCSLNEFCQTGNYNAFHENDILNYSDFKSRIENEMNISSNDWSELVKSVTDIIVEIDESRGSLTPSDSMRLQLDDLRNYLATIQLQLIKRKISPEEAKIKATLHGVER